MSAGNWGGGLNIFFGAEMPAKLAITPRHKTDTCRKKILEELIFARIHVGPVFALLRIQENTLEELFLKYVFAPLPPTSL